MLNDSPNTALDNYKSFNLIHLKSVKYHTFMDEAKKYIYNTQAKQTLGFIGGVGYSDFKYDLKIHLIPHFDL